MKKINVKTIRIDGGTQSRVEINNEAVADYAEAIRAGVEFPPVVVFHDGADYWLADGFHRYHAHNQAEKASIAADVRDGTKRDAVLYSLGANAAHGLRRTNADKRKAVETVLRDAEWVTWSDRKIAEICGVGAPLVGDVRKAICNPITDAPAVRTVERAGKTYQQDTSNIGKAAPAPAVCESVQAEEEEPAAEDFGPSPEELAAQAREEEDERAALQKLIESDDKLSTLDTENKRLRAMNRVLEERVRGLMNEKNEAIRMAKSWQRKFEKAERAAREAV